MPSKSKTGILCILIAQALSSLFSSHLLSAQCTAVSTGGKSAMQIQSLYEQKNWGQVVHIAGSLPSRSADVNFQFGLALAHLERWNEARSALLKGERACPGQKRFPIELAGVAFELKNYPEAAHSLRRALKLDPNDEYANNFAGTVFLLMGNVNAALKYWNRVQKPQISTIQFDPQLKVQRLILDRSFAFSPAALLKARAFETTQARLDQLEIFPRHNIVLTARDDGKFDVSLHAQERDGFGNGPLEALVSIFGGAAYDTIYPSYFNILRSAANVESLFRWDAQKRRAWVAVSAPLNQRPQFRWRMEADLRNENWAIRRSFTGDAPVLGSLNLEREALTGLVTGVPSRRLQWSLGASGSHRNYRNVESGIVLTPALVAPGYEVKGLLSLDDKLLEIAERRFTLNAAASSEFARTWPAQSQPNSPQHFAKLQGAALAHWYPQAQGDRYELAERVRAGGIFGESPFDELYLLGIERDTDLWLRGQIGTRDGRKGSSPLGSNFFLSNTDIDRLIFDKGIFSVKGGPLLDIAKAGAPTRGLATGQSTQQWLFDVGVEAKLTVLGTSVVLTYGRDLRSGANAFYGTVAK